MLAHERERHRGWPQGRPAGAIHGGFTAPGLVIFIVMRASGSGWSAVVWAGSPPGVSVLVQPVRNSPRRTSATCQRTKVARSWQDMVLSVVRPLNIPVKPRGVRSGRLGRRRERRRAAQVAGWWGGRRRPQDGTGRAGPFAHLRPDRPGTGPGRLGSGCKARPGQLRVGTRNGSG